ncbi:hypothetical protein GCM10010170_105460 [Dactylosporangium salmoneum]|uniref:Uncharacterized protein n=1 Tax=Dactylosporangium salmoneum TaxID=53361 RepID=A0ABP5V2G8_9ACTN
MATLRSATTASPLMSPSAPAAARPRAVDMPGMAGSTAMDAMIHSIAQVRLMMPAHSRLRRMRTSASSTGISLTRRRHPRPEDGANLRSITGRTPKERLSGAIRIVGGGHGP